MEPEPECFKVELVRKKTRLDAYLTTLMPEMTRGAAQRLIQNGAIRVNGNEVKPSYSVSTGDIIRIDWPEPEAPEARPEPIPLDILYEDASLLVVNKPPGLVIHPAAGHPSGTLVNGLLYHCGDQLSGVGGVARPGIVHRLDKDTSGAMVVAKNDRAHTGLSEQFAARSVGKVYDLMVCGSPDFESTRVDAAIARHETQRKRMAIDSKRGRPASTIFHVQERFSAATRLTAELLTGRTHQIRVHITSLGFPILGDATYGARLSARVAKEMEISIPRQLLHAGRLAFTHPISGEAIHIEAPLAPDFLAVLSSLRGQRLKH